MHLTETQLIARVPVWHALSELLPGANSEYDYQWMAEVLKNPD